MNLPDFAKASFLGSFLETDSLPPYRNIHGKILPEIALIGKSNVGKSSLINALTRRKGLAKASSTPGKTQMLNFFMIDDSLILVDLPGYGYAKVNKESKALWAEHLDHFIQKRPYLKALFLLVDIRRELCEEDLMIIEFCRHEKRKLILIFTKTDKASVQERLSSVEKNLAIAQTHYAEPIEHFLFSIKEPKARDLLIKKAHSFR